MASSPRPSPPEEERVKNQEIQPKLRLIQWQWRERAEVRGLKFEV